MKKKVKKKVVKEKAASTVKAKAKKIKVVDIEVDDYKPPRTYKIVGYCPKCDIMLSKKDFVSKMIFECPCGCRKHKKYLRLISKRDRKRKVSQAISKNQYLKEAKSVKYAAPDHHASNLPDVSSVVNVQE